MKDTKGTKFTRRGGPEVLFMIFMLFMVTIPASAGVSDRLLDAIEAQESGGSAGAPGDGGLAIGPYQIHRDYWTDGTKFLKVKWPYSDATDREKARKVTRAYLEYYGKHHGRMSDQDYARMHNGGPTGWEKGSTVDYWKDVKGRMNGKEKSP